MDCTYDQSLTAKVVTRKGQWRRMQYNSLCKVIQTILRLKQTASAKPLKPSKMIVPWWLVEKFYPELDELAIRIALVTEGPIAVSYCVSDGFHDTEWIIQGHRQYLGDLMIVLNVQNLQIPGKPPMQF